MESDQLFDFDCLSRAALMAPGSITHHCDMTARYVELSSAPVQGANNKRLFQIPGKPRVQRGYYMKLVLNSALRPSVATWMRIQ